MPTLDMGAGEWRLAYATTPSSFIKTATRSSAYNFAPSGVLSSFMTTTLEAIVFRFSLILDLRGDFVDLMSVVLWGYSTTLGVMLMSMCHYLAP